MQILHSVRRYACAVTGSLPGGDRRLRLLVEELLLDPPSAEDDGDARFRLFTLFHRQRNGSNGDAAPPTGKPHPIERQLAALSPSERELLLLVHLEDFTPQEAARIVGIPAPEARRHLHNVRLRLSEWPSEPPASGPRPISVGLRRRFGSDAPASERRPLLRTRRRPSPLIGAGASVRRSPPRPASR